MLKLLLIYQLYNTGAYKVSP